MEACDNFDTLRGCKGDGQAIPRFRWKGRRICSECLREELDK